MNKVTKEDIEDAWKNISNQKILNKCISTSKIARTDIGYYKFMSLFKAMKYYDPIKGMRFTSYLYFTTMQIINKKRYKIPSHKELKDNRAYYQDDLMELEDLKVDIGVENIRVLENRFIGKHSMKELSDLYNTTPRKISRKIQSIRKKILDL